MGKRLVIHNYIYIIALILLAFFMPLKPSFTSFCQFLLIFNYIIEWDFKAKFNRLKENKDILLFTFLFFASIIWLFNTENFDWAWKDIVIKAPLLAIPIIIGSSKKISKKHISYILMAMVAGTLLTTILGYLNYKGIITIKTDNLDFRKILSPFISNIRLALFIAISIYAFIYWLWAKEKNKKKYFLKFVIILPMAFWLLFFLAKIEGFTAIVAIIATLFFLFLYNTIKEKNIKLKIVKIIGLIIFPLIIASFLTYRIIDFYTATAKFSDKETTKLGNKYNERGDERSRENGNFVYDNVCKKEIINNWPKYSDYDIYGKSDAGNSLYFVLLRYMTSKGLTKDAEGLEKLSKEDIKNIENGETNYKYIKTHGINHRIYTILSGLTTYYYSGDPSGYSVAQRLEYHKIGVMIFLDNFFLGCGTGDIKDTYDEYYEKYDTKLEPRYRHRAHNQFLTSFICYGIFGGLISLFVWFYPVFKNRKKLNYFFVCFFITATISMFSDDMFETATAVAFIAFYYSIFLWGYENEVQTVTNDENQIIS